jgi:nucleotide-binding universal stress UspA family protein
MKAKTIWFAFDPFQRNVKSQRSALRTATVYAELIGAQVEPVYFADLFRGSSTGSYFFPLIPLAESATFAELAVQATKIWEERCRAEGIKTLPLRVFTHKKDDVPTLEGMASMLSNRAKRAGVEWVTLQTRGSSGAKRLLMGSFAETFLLTSSVPTLLLSPSADAWKRPRHLLFASDLSPASLVAFQAIAPMLSDMTLRISLLYCLELPLDFGQIFRSKEQSRLDVDKLVRFAKPRIEAKSKNFFEVARSCKLKMKLKIASCSYLSSKAEAILNAADDLNVDCIALASSTGRLKTAMVGATSRNVARGARCPVLIYRA